MHNQIIVSIIQLFFPLFATISVQIFALVLSQPHLSPQDDSDDEPPTAKRAHGRTDGLEYIDMSCEEGEETASSEVHTEVSHSPLDCDFGKMFHLQAPVVFVSFCFKQFPVFLFLICSGQ